MQLRFSLHPITLYTRFQQSSVQIPLYCCSKLFCGVEKTRRRKKAAELLRAFGLNDLIRNYPEELSGGEQQRVAIARSLANEPKVLLADEPTGNLNSTLAKEVVSILEGINKERKLTVLFVTHDQRLINKYMKILTLKDGAIVEEIER